MNAAFYRRMFLLSAIWNLVGGVVLVLFMEPIFALSNVAVPEPPVWYYCWIALFVTFGIGVVLIHRNPRQSLVVVRVGIVGKVSFSIIYVYFFFAHRDQVPAFVLIGVVGDLIFAVLYGMFLRFAAMVPERQA